MKRAQPSKKDIQRRKKYRKHSRQKRRLRTALKRKHSLEIESGTDEIPESEEEQVEQEPDEQVDQETDEQVQSGRRRKPSKERYHQWSQQMRWFSRIEPEPNRVRYNRCIICLLGKNEEGLGPLTYPCNCRSEIGRYHYTCLCNYIEATGDKDCIKCGVQFNNPRLHRYNEEIDGQPHRMIQFNDYDGPGAHRIVNITQIQQKGLSDEEIAELIGIEEAPEPQAPPPTEQEIQQFLNNARTRINVIRQESQQRQQAFSARLSSPGLPPFGRGLSPFGQLRTDRSPLRLERRISPLAYEQPFLGESSSTQQRQQPFSSRSTRPISARLSPFGQFRTDRSHLGLERRLSPLPYEQSFLGESSRSQPSLEQPFLGESSSPQSSAQLPSDQRSDQTHRQLGEYIPPPKDDEGDGEQYEQEQFVNQLKQQTSGLREGYERLQDRYVQPEQSGSGIRDQEYGESED